MESKEKRRHSSSKPLPPPPPSGAGDSDDSPKHAKRDRKPATERHIPEVDPPLIPSENDRFRKRRLQDPLPLEENPRGRAQGRHTEKKEPLDSNINSVPVNPTHVPRSSSYFQHDDRSGRSTKRRAPDDRWMKSRNNDTQRDSSPTQDRKSTRHESSQVSLQTKPDDSWGHDKFLEIQAEDPERKRRQSPSERTRHTGRRTFTEKPPIRSENMEEQKGDNPEKRAEKKYPDMNLARRERERYQQRGEDLERGRWMDSDRYQPKRGNGRYLGDGNRRFDSTRRNSDSIATVTTEKWTHDRFEELNRSPTPKKEEDSIAQIEALLAA